MKRIPFKEEQLPPRNLFMSAPEKNVSIHRQEEQKLHEALETIRERVRINEVAHRTAGKLRK